jgi:hypothetical protein
MRHLRVVALLREAGYNFNVIHSILDELTTGRLEKAIEAVEKRREELLTWLMLTLNPLILTLIVSPPVYKYTAFLDDFFWRSLPYTQAKATPLWMSSKVSK